MSEEKWSATHDARLAALETGFAGLREDVASIKKDISSLAQGVNQSSKTDWNTLASWAAVLVVVIGGFVSLLTYSSTKDISRIDDDSSHLTKEFVQHIRDGHPRRVEDKTTRNAQAIEMLDVTLQREMRQEDAKIQTALDALDTRLQNEMGFRQEKIIVMLGELSRRMAETEEWQRDHDKRVVGLNAAQWERIKALERAIFNKPGPVEHGKPPGSGE